MLGAVLLRSEGAVLLKSRRSIPEAVGGGTTEESNAIKVKSVNRIKELL